MARGCLSLKKQKVSNAVVGRLPRYFRRLDELYTNGVVRISSKDLGSSMGLTASQIRQDLSCFGEFGQQGYGYNVENLRREITDILGMNRKNTAVILGVGNLGRALIQNFSFARSGFTLTAAFDVNPSIVGSSINNIPVYSIDRLEQYLEGHPTKVGVLTVPRGEAQSLALRLQAAGVPGLWNFTSINAALLVPDMVVENVHFSDSLRTLSYHLSEGKESS